MFEAGKVSDCLATDAVISMGKKNTEQFYWKLDKTKGSQPVSPERTAYDLLETGQPGPD